MKITREEIISIILSIIILSIALSYQKTYKIDSFILYLFTFSIVIGINILVKKFISKDLNIKIKIRLWKIYYYGFGKNSHFKEPLPMIWLPFVFVIFFKSNFIWMPLLTFDYEKTPARTAKIKGKYRLYEVTEWELGKIASISQITNLILGIFLILTGTNTLIFIGKISIYYAAWSLIPISDLDGNKILFQSRYIWLILSIITGIALFITLII